MVGVEQEREVGKVQGRSESDLEKMNISFSLEVDAS